MRLFYAVTFNETVRRKLSDIQDALRAHTVRGNYTLFENLHLTLVFIGEVSPERTEPLFKIAESMTFAPLPLRIQGVGSFRREGGQIVWAGVQENTGLSEIYEKLAGRVSAAGFRVEERRFTPHLTLAREVKFQENFILREFSCGISPIDTTANKVSLMQSERKGGKLVYTEIG